MSTATRQCRTPLGLFANRPFPRLYDRIVEVLRHRDVRPSMIDTHVLNGGGRGVRSPADGLVRLPDERQAGAACRAGNFL